jgi:SAM-dependent methyltransferase
MREDDIRPAVLMDQFHTLLRRDAERLSQRSDGFVAIHCAFCGEDQPVPAFTKTGFDYQLCGACGSLYLSPRPTAEALRRHAAGSEAVEFWSTHFYAQTAAARREKMFRPRAALVADLLESGVVDGTHAIADIGAGYGMFLQEIAELSLFDLTVGVEPDERLAAICREQGFEVVPSWAEDLRPDELNVDCATAFEVIEHVSEPLTFLRGCANALRPGGVLLLTTLTIGGFDVQTLWAEARSISPPEHINLPSIAGVSALFARAGFEEIEVSTPGELDVDIVRNYLAADPTRDVSRFARAVALADDETREDFQRFLQRRRLSSHLRGIVRKPK